MKKLVIALAMVLGCVCLTGCGKQGAFTAQPTELQTVLERPKHTFIAQTSGIEVMVGFPKEYAGGELEALVGVGNTTDSVVWASASDIKVYYGFSEPEENPIKVLGYDDLQTGVKVKNFFDKLAIFSVASVALAGAAASGHHYETSTFSGAYTGPEWNQGGTFVGSLTTHYYDPEENRQNVEYAAATGAGILEKTKIRCANRYAALAAEYFGGERLEPGYSVIKKIIVKGLKVQEDAQLVNVEIRVAGLTRKFLFSLVPRGKKVEDVEIPVDTEAVSPEEELTTIKAQENRSSWSLPLPR